MELRGRRGFLLERSFIKRDSLRGGSWGVLVVGRGGGSVFCGEGYVCMALFLQAMGI